MRVLAAEILAFMKEVLENHKDLDRATLSRSAEMFSMSESARHDMKTIAAIMRHTEEEPLPILWTGIRAAVSAVRVFSDASRSASDNSSLGLYVPSRGREPALVVSLAFPISFMRKIDIRKPRLSNSVSL